LYILIDQNTIIALYFSWHFYLFHCIFIAYSFYKNKKKRCGCT